MLNYLRSRILPSKPAQLLIQTGMKWDKDDCPGMAASLSYFALFSLFPMLLVLLSVLGAWIRPGSAEFQQIQTAVEQFLPPEVHDLIESTVIALNQNSVGAGIIGFSLLMWAASSVFAILRHSVNKIWRSPEEAPPNRSIPKLIFFFIANRLFSFVLVLGTGLVLVAALATNIVIRAVVQLVEAFPLLRIDQLKLDRGLQAGSAFFILSITLCILFKTLPTIRVSWNDVWLGALLTAGLLVGLQQLVSNSVISIGSHFLSYGVVGSVMILLLWIFLTGQIFLFGCVFTYTYAHLFGSRQ
ncbi:YihY/virulence factor BrkB family protein [Leptolyngbya sp. NIES-2104]|uniref:YihY/virulence factor BrkB family protein n=1 Tax=Leptolyngbya sp. NIES-2104 TaxID=1552121 RepID=UPI0006EC60BD|nr:YihY/virulence factor BrkB family protein [Leptolyngbya sp. NIES-2104]GAP94635.1 tRNA (Ile)-lysidine synthetase [Leptolyngbya sp. NIES-2104]